MSLPPSPVSGRPRPWEQRPLNKLVQAGLFLLTIVMASVVIAGLLVVVMLTLDPPATGGPGLGAVAIATVLLLVCGAGLRWSIPLLNSSVHTQPSYTPLPPMIKGRPFDVLYHSTGLTSRSLNGRGGVRFDAEGLTVEGTLQPHVVLQLVIAVVLAAVLLFVFHLRASVFVAGLLTLLIGRKTVRRTIPYSDIRDLEVKGVQVRFRCDGQPGQVVLRAAPVDGERLYRELLARFPGALGGWTI